MTKATTMLSDGLRYRRGGLSLLPIGRNKRPHAPSLPKNDAGKATWTPYQSQRADDATIERWCSTPGVVGLAAVCGAVSGNLLVIDFDEERFYHAWCAAVGDRINHLPVQRTGGGGYQVAMRCDDPGRSQKLAWVPDDTEKSGRRIAIETRGEGGYANLPPTLHPCSNRYVWITDQTFADAPYVEMADVHFMLDAARRLDESPYSRQQLAKIEAQANRAKPKPRPSNNGDVSVIDAFNKAVPIIDMLKRAGYTEWGERFTRPAGGNKKPTPGGVVLLNGRSYHHSTNDILNDGHTHDSFDVFCECEHGGDVRAAVRAAASELGIESKRQSANRRKRSSAAAVKQKRGEFHCTDLGNAERLVARFGKQIRYCHETGKWLVWSRNRWTPDNKGRLMRMAAKTARSIFAEAAKAKLKPRKEELAEWAVKSESRSHLEAMVKLAQSQPGIAVTAGELDANGWVLNCHNGTIDLRSGELRPHNPDDLITKLAPVEYDPDAECPLWLKFLDRIFDRDADLIQFVQRWHGHSLTADISEQYLPIYHGEGNNGKNVLVDTIKGVIGDYASEAPPELLMVSKHREHPTEIADLLGRRLVVASETEEGGMLRLQFVKRLTGDARLKGRYMRQDYFEFPRTHKLILITNNKPRVKENSEAVWRRLRLVPFEVVIPPEERDKRLLKKLEAEWPGILAWLVRGCLDWQRDGLGEPAAVTRATQTYRDESDPLVGFVDECCALGPNCWASSADLRAVYEKWCGDNGEPPVSATRFGTTLKKHPYNCMQEKRAGKRGWAGIGLLHGHVGQVGTGVPG